MASCAVVGEPDCSRQAKGTICTDMRLLPKTHEKEVGWVTYVWLAYLIFFLGHPILDHVGWKEWIATVFGLLAFLGLYFSFFWMKPPRGLFNLAGMVLLGVLFAPYNTGAAGFFIYASVFVPFAVVTELVAAGLLAVIVGVIALEW